MATHLKNTICGNLLRIRTAKRYSQQEIANVLAVKQPSYQGMEVGRTQINAVQLGTLAIFYSISIQCFYQDDFNLCVGDAFSATHEEWLADQLLRHKKLLDKYLLRIEGLELLVKKLNGLADDDQFVHPATPFFAKHMF